MVNIFYITQKDTCTNIEKFEEVVTIYVPSHEKTCINNIKYDFLFLNTPCVSNCAEQMLKISCSYLI